MFYTKLSVCVFMYVKRGLIQVGDKLFSISHFLVAVVVVLLSS